MNYIADTPVEIGISLVGVFTPGTVDLSRFTNSYPHRCGRRICKQRNHTQSKRINQIAAYKQQMTTYAPPYNPSF